MNIMIFLLISLVVHIIPLPYTPGMLSARRLIRWLPLRLIWGVAAWFVICLVMMATLPWAILALVMSFGLMLLMSTGFRPGDIEEVMQGLRVPITCLGFMILLIMPVFTGLITWTSDVNNAYSFNDNWVTEDNSELFENPIPDNMVRLVTSEYATFLANQKIASIGSEVSISAAHITTYNDRLVWVCSVVSTNVLAQNYMKAVIIVDANDPSPDKIEIIENMEFPYAEGLFWDRDIQFGNYLNDMTNIYEYAYPTWDNHGDFCYVQTRTNLAFNFVENPIGPVVYYENGTRTEFATVADTPDWITQKYSEQWLERQVTRWGGYRRNNTFDLFAGGFLWIIPPSSDRLEMTEDTRYILNPDTNRVEAFIAVHPPSGSSSSQLSLSGIFRATSNGIYYHDLRGAGYQSGSSAINQVKTANPLLQTGNYEGAMPLLYPVRVSPTVTRYAWYCPIYWYSVDTSGDTAYLNDLRLQGLALVDAIDTSKLFYQEAGGSLRGGDLVQAAREGYINVMGGSIQEEPVDTFNMTATVLNKTSYVYDGATQFLLRTDNSSYEFILGTRDWMNLTDWYNLLTINEGDSFTATINIVGDEYRIVAFVKI